MPPVRRRRFMLMLREGVGETIHDNGFDLSGKSCFELTDVSCNEDEEEDVAYIETCYVTNSDEFEEFQHLVSRRVKFGTLFIKCTDLPQIKGLMDNIEYINSFSLYHCNPYFIPSAAVLARVRGLLLYSCGGIMDTFPWHALRDVQCLTLVWMGECTRLPRFPLLKALRTLRLVGAEYVTSVDNIPQFAPRLRDLNLHEFLALKSVHSLGQLAYLKHLSLQSCGKIGMGKFDHVLPPMRRLMHLIIDENVTLTTLDLNHYPSLVLLRAIECTRLQKVVLNTKLGLLHLEDCPDLHAIEGFNVSDTAPGLIHIKSCPSLMSDSKLLNDLQELLLIDDEDGANIFNQRRMCLDFAHLLRQRAAGMNFNAVNAA